MPNINMIDNEAKAKLNDELKKAIESNDAKRVAEIFEEKFLLIEQNMLAEAKKFNIKTADATTLVARGFKVLTTEEKSYFTKLIECAKSTDKEKAFTGLTETLPETVIDAIFDDIKEEHPILEEIDCRNTSALVKFYLNTKEPQKAVWGELTSAIIKELEGSAEVKEVILSKLTAFMYISNDMLDLGPTWIEKYVRTCLAEALSYGIEDGIINGKGVKGEPIGMVRNLNGSINQTTGYPKKTATTVTKLDAQTYGTLLATLAKSSTGRTRRVPKVTIFVNPVDYFTKVFPAITSRSLNGGYVTDVVPYPTKFIQSSEVAEGEAIFGISKKYKFCYGKGSQGGKIEKSKDFKFLEDLETYKIKLYASGRATDNNSFLLLNISNLEPLAPATSTVVNVEVEAPTTEAAETT